MPFSQYLEIESDQRLLARWWEVPVRLSPEGGIDARVVHQGRMVQQQPNPSRGLLLLTDKGLVHCQERTSRALLGPTSVIGAFMDVKIPRSKMQELRVEPCPGLDRPVLVVTVDGDAATFSPEYVVGQVAGTNEIRFLLDEQADPQGRSSRWPETRCTSGTTRAPHPLRLPLRQLRRSPWSRAATAVADIGPLTRSVRIAGPRKGPETRAGCLRGPFSGPHDPRSNGGRAEGSKASHPGVIRPGEVTGTGGGSWTRPSWSLRWCA